MKKLWMLAAVATGMLASCSNDSDVTPGATSSQEEDNSPMLMQLGARSDVLVVKPLGARSGTGSVGGTDSPDDWNQWDGEDVYVYAVDQRETLEPEATRVVINNEKASTKNITGSNGLLELQGGKTHYYSGKGLYEFYAYHIDDAGVVPEYNYGDALKADVTIDGTQDLMVATTDKTSDIQYVLDNLDANPLPEGRELKLEDTPYLYSAWSARRNVVPTLNFKHLLARLKFYVKAGDASSKDAGLKIKSIEVLNAKSKGVLTIIPTADETQGFVADADQPEDVIFSLKQKPATGADKTLVELVETDVTTTDNMAIGQSMLLIPDAKYTVRVVMTQERNGVREDVKGEYEITAKDAENQATTFEAGKSYNVYVTIYESRPIEIKASLGVWENGGSATIDPDDKPNN